LALLLLLLRRLLLLLPSGHRHQPLLSPHVLLLLLHQGCCAWALPCWLLPLRQVLDALLRAPWAAGVPQHVLKLSHYLAKAGP
jgi:hypothetical protein